jgi:cell division protein FtsL
VSPRAATVAARTLVGEEELPPPQVAAAGRAARPRPSAARPRTSATRPRPAAPRSRPAAAPRTAQKTRPAKRRPPAPSARRRQQKAQIGVLAPPEPVRRPTATFALPERAVDRLLRTRLWIGTIALLLVGIVFLNVDLLQVSRQLAAVADRSAQVEADNARLRRALARLDSPDRIQRLASERGFVLPAPDAVRYLRPDPGRDALLAARRLAQRATAGTAGTAASAVSAVSAASGAATTTATPAPGAAGGGALSGSSSAGAATGGPSASGATGSSALGTAGEQAAGGEGVVDSADGTP